MFTLKQANLELPLDMEVHRPLNHNIVSTISLRAVLSSPDKVVLSSLVRCAFKSSMVCFQVPTLSSISKHTHICSHAVNLHMEIAYIV